MRGVPRRSRRDSARRASRISSAATAEPGLTSADVEKAIHAAMADMPQPEAGLSKSEVEEIVKAAVAAIPQPEPGLTSADAERIARGIVSSIPPKSAPAEFFVQNAIIRYDAQRLDATARPLQGGESIDGQWYVSSLTRTARHRTSRPSPPGAGPEGLGGNRRQRLRLRAGCCRQQRTASGCPTSTGTREHLRLHR